MTSKWLAAIVQGVLPFAAAVAVWAIAATPAQADELIVSLSPLSDVVAGSTGNSFDVLLTNASASAVSIAGFTFEVLTASPDISFIGATTATATPYILAPIPCLGRTLLDLAAAVLTWARVTWTLLAQFRWLRRQP